MSTQDHENEAFLWESLDQTWANLSNPEDFSIDKAGNQQPEPEEGEASKKGKKRGRGAAGKGVGDKKKEVEAASDHEMHIWTERERRKKMRNMFSTLHSLLPQLPPKADKSSIVDEAVNFIKTLQGTLQRLQKQKLERLQAGGTSNPNSRSSLSCDNHPSSIAATSQLAMLSTREAFMADQVASIKNNDTNINNNNNNNNNSGIIRPIINTPSHLPVFIQTWTSNNVVLNICGDDAQFLVYATKKAGLLTSVCGVLEKYKIDVLSAHISSDNNRSVYMIQSRVTKGVSDELSEIMSVEDRFKQAGGEISMWVSS